MQADMRALRMLTLARRCCAGGERALLIAARAGCEDLVELIAGFKTNVNVSDATGKTVLLQGCGQNSPAAGPLHWASQEGHLAVVQVLLKVGTDVEARKHVSLKRETLTHAATALLRRRCKESGRCSGRAAGVGVSVLA